MGTCCLESFCICEKGVPLKEVQRGNLHKKLHKVYLGSFDL